MMKRSFQRSSLVRILPALFVGLIPFSLFEDALLQAKYHLRGDLAPLESSKLLLAKDRNEVQAMLATFPKWDAAECYLITTEKLDGGPCHTVSIADLYSADEITQAVFGGDTHPPPLFYGSLASFRPIDAEVALNRASTAMKGAQNVIILDQSYKPKIPIATHIGTLDQGSFAVNALTNKLENRHFRLLPKSVEWAISVAMALLTTLVLYSYPTTLTLAFMVILGTLEFSVSFLLFEQDGIHLPLAGSWFSMLTVVLLGMGDRLDRRERREWAVEQEAEALKRLDEMRNNFLSLVSHDLKTPIARILSLLDRFARGEFGTVTPQQASVLDRVVSTSGYLQRTISTLLLLSRIESRDFTIHRAPADLNEILEACVKQHQLLAQEREIQILKEFEPLFLIDIDRDLITQVVNNLLENALKYSPARSTITVRSGEVENASELSPPQPAAWFEIQDEGPGIPLDDRKRVLQKFMRGTNESTASDQSVKGTGLGLYLSVFFVEKHGGTLRLFSQAKGESSTHQDASSDYFTAGQSGTVLRVTLPIDPPLVDMS